MGKLLELELDRICNHNLEGRLLLTRCMKVGARIAGNL